MMNAVVCSVSDMAEPAYDYAHPPTYHPTPKKYPHKEAFDRYNNLLTMVCVTVLLLYHHFC